MKNALCFCLLSCLTLAGIAQIPTTEEIFNFNIGDKFHYQCIGSVSPNGQRKTVLEKSYSLDMDTVFYLIENDSYSTTFVSSPEPHLEYNFALNTTEVFYTQLNEPITTYDSGFQYDLLFSQGLLGCEINLIGYEYSLGEFEPEFWSRRYAVGMGITYDYYAWIGGGGSSCANTLVYVEKEEIVCGSPDSTSLNIPVIDLDDMVIYPNPAHEQITVQQSASQYRYYKIYNGSGLEVKAGILTGSTQTISLTGITKGVYTLLSYNEQRGYKTSTLIIR